MSKKKASECRALLKPIADYLKKEGFRVSWLKGKSGGGLSCPPGYEWPIVCRVKFTFNIVDRVFWPTFHLVLDLSTSTLVLMFQELKREHSEMAFPYDRESDWWKARYQSKQVEFTSLTEIATSNLLFCGDLAHPATDPTAMPDLIKKRTIKFLEQKKEAAQRGIDEIRVYTENLAKGKFE